MNAKMIELTRKFVKESLPSDPTGHDFQHAERVYRNSLFIAKNEKTTDIFVVKLASLLHDIADFKFHNDEKKGGKVARIWLEKNKVEPKIIDKVVQIIDSISFRGGLNPPMIGLEGKIVQDADRLDALGAIGIARAFAYGGFKKREIYNPKIRPQKYKSLRQYKNNNGTTINHFYEKLLLLKDNMNTNTGKRMALKRHKFLEDYLKQFYREWDGLS